MSDPSESRVLDLVFPPEQCDEQLGRRYQEHGYTEEPVRYESGYIPYLAHGYYEGAGG